MTWPQFWKTHKGDVWFVLAILAGAALLMFVPDLTVGWER